jgi:hypothetical protein
MARNLEQGLGVRNQGSVVRSREPDPHSQSIRVNEAYFEVDDSGDPRGDPYCSHCWETKFQAIHLKTAKHAANKECPSCKAVHQSHRVWIEKESA